MPRDPSRSAEERGMAAILDDPEIRAAIDARVAKTGRPREIYERYMVSPPPTGCTFDEAVPIRVDILRAGPPTQQFRALLRDMTASVPDTQNPAA